MDHTARIDVEWSGLHRRGVGADWVFGCAEIFDLETYARSEEGIRTFYDGEMAGWRLEHSYADLPQLFYTPAAPTPVREPRLIAFNRPLAALLGLDPDALASPE